MTTDITPGITAAREKALVAKKRALDAIQGFYVTIGTDRNVEFAQYADAALDEYEALIRAEADELVKAAQGCVDWFATLAFIPDCGFPLEAVLAKYDAGETAR